MNSRKPSIERILLPFEEFVHLEASGGVLLLLCTVLALIWANSPWSSAYTSLWQTQLVVGLGDFSLAKPLLLWINDGLMAIFFLVVGLEIKREVLVGELASLQQAALPIAAAAGGMVAGVDYLLPLYKEANTYPHLLEQGITGSPEALTPAELHGRAWEIVQPCFLEAKQAARAQYQELAGAGRTSTDVKEVVLAAGHGRVEVLFVAVGIQRWGRFVPETNTVHLSAEPTPGDEDLSDLAAIQTVFNGGTVYAVEPEKVPDGAPLAAIFRY